MLSLDHRDAAAGVCSETELQARHEEYARDAELHMLLTSWREFRNDLLDGPPVES